MTYLAVALTTPGDKATWIVIASVAFAAGVLVAVLLAAGRRLEKRSPHEPKHRI